LKRACSTERVAERDAGEASGDRGDARGGQIEAPAGGERARDGEQQFVGNRQAEDAEDLREEEERRAEAQQPGRELAFHDREIIAFRRISGAWLETTTSEGRPI
jgi:hypothetical protein